MSDKLIGLPPVTPEYPKVLILGSMPSVLSLKNQEYYGNPRNHFWKILAELFQVDSPNSYREKMQLVHEHHIALWDAIGACYREGSLDTNITNEEPNDIAGIIEKYPTIRLIACNGTKAYQTFAKYKPNDLSVDTIKLPSSSPIPGKYNKTFEEKVASWRRLLVYL
ncbi:DNA-deoxyinosine glycosylase [Ornithinibacillus halophilus]|uniref:G/U mismatch-specific uracil-DNA glycosylase n=1 Tax=Ornithinibacillus halophilus TaxID=930117 RepID=A0A1M5LZF3_9BACI|nr:DNA-deoxyinosine glycosylase [Ornithinibacillus halophilus]SHG70401.1 G/U mismatch-specific uracil-DNA glycosylase [Ornithinibacillus halophilus]